MKKKMGTLNCLYPMPAVLVGANVNGKPNYLPIAHVGIMTLNAVSLGMNKMHYTNRGIKENESFSINIPSEEMVVETDYCGLVSGERVDKSALFKSFYGGLKHAPMIESCLINIECRLINTVDMGSHDIFIGEINETFCDEKILTNEVVDYGKLKPILFDMNSRGYWKLGERFADAWRIGNKIKK